MRHSIANSPRSSLTSSVHRLCGANILCRVWCRNAAPLSTGLVKTLVEPPAYIAVNRFNCTLFTHIVLRLGFRGGAKELRYTVVQSVDMVRIRVHNC